MQTYHSRQPSEIRTLDSHPRASRQASIHQLLSASTSKMPVQCGKRLYQSETKLRSKSELEQAMRRRVARSARILRAKNLTRTRKNLLLVSVKVGTKTHTFHLLSAGMGGKHPRYQGKSASHTEQIWRGLSKSGLIGKYLNKKQPKTVAIYSRNQACDSNSSMPKGCRDIPCEDMGMEKDTPFFYSASYATGGKKESITIPRMEKMDAGDRDPDSEDEWVDTDKYRGMEIEEMKLPEFEKSIQHNPKLL